MSLQEKTKENSVGSAPCEAKRGFFTLYDCGKRVANQCSACKRSLCLEHFPKGLKRCVECTAKARMSSQYSNTDKDQMDPQSRSSHHDLVVAYHNREAQLKSNKGQSIYLGKQLSDYYQRFDIRSFDVELSSIADMADSPDEVFFDS